MKTISFIWDKNKANENLKKHKIPFKEAQTVFYRPKCKNDLRF